MAERVKKEKSYEILHRCSEINKAKNAEYGNTVDKFGRVMNAMFPEGLTITGEKQWAKFGLFHQLMHKILRISSRLFDDNISLDSTTDLAVYSAMLEAYIRENKIER